MFKNIVKKKGVMYFPFLMLLFLFFVLMIGSSFTWKNSTLYLEYDRKSETSEFSDIIRFLDKLNFYKEEYYLDIDSEVIESEVSFLNYIQDTNKNLFNGNFYILDFKWGNKINSDNEKILLYYSEENDKSYYFYAQEYGRRIKLDIARNFKL